MKTYGIYVVVFGVRREIVEFRNRQDAEKALKYLKSKINIDYEIVEEKVYESFDEFLEDKKESVRGFTSRNHRR